MATPLDDAPTPLVLAKLGGTVLGHRYGLGRILGAGGMGAVFEAKDLRLERAVAIKVLRPAFAGRSDYIERFLREARAASRIRHRNVVVILDHGEAAGGLVYSVMELCVGQDLEQLLRSQPDQRLPWAQACGLLAQIASGLKAAHAQGVIHRDIKPANCFVTEEDDEPVVKVVDFGIAKLDDSAQTQQITQQQLTSASDILGTPSYIAPELVRTHRSASPRSDVYSLGVLAYRVLTGCLPFTGATAFEVMRRACMDPVPSLRERVPGLPAAVEGLVLEMLAKEPRGRPADMITVRQRLQAIELQTAEVAVSRPLPPHGRPTRATATRSDATPALGELCRSALRSGSRLESTAVLPSPQPVGVVGPPGVPLAVIVTPTAAPRWMIHNPLSIPSRSAETLPGMDSATLPMADSVATERPRRTMKWLAATVGGMTAFAASMATILSKEPHPLSDAVGEVAVVDPGSAQATVKQPEPDLGLPPAGTQAEAANGTVVVEPAPEPPVAEPKPERDRPPHAERRSSPPPDEIIEKRLARKIRAKCALASLDERLTVSFFVTKSGAISLLTATPTGTAGRCARQQVDGTKFRARARDTPIQIVVK